MSTGLYPDIEIIERFLASVSASTIAQRFIAPCDLDVIGMALWVSAAPGSGDGVAVNISVQPVSQQGTGSLAPASYNMWTSANVPTILGFLESNVVTSQNTTFYGAQSLVDNFAYALNYPLPGPSGTVGFVTAQRTTTSVSTPVTSPPVLTNYGIQNLVTPDNTYTDFNGVTQPASLIHAGDVLSFVITAAGTGSSVGSAANLEMCLYTNKH